MSKRIPTPQETANLNRIRDNQRRSRARRKEYLEELRQRLRLCELQGIEASSEIQVAARRVADENKKLRILLNKHGIHDDNIEHFLGTGVAEAPHELPTDHYRTTPSGGAVQSLEQLLEPRRPRCFDPNSPFCPPPPNMHGGLKSLEAASDGRSRETSVTSISTPTIWEPIPYPADHGIPGSTTSQGSRVQSAPQFIPPARAGSNLSRTDAAIALQGLGSRMEDHRSSASSNPSPASIVGDSHSQQAYGYGMHHLIPNSSSYSQSSHSSQRFPVQSVPSPVSSTYRPTAASESNCSMATDIITGMTGVDPQHVRGQLGCVPGLDCHVDTASFSNVVDRYTAATTIRM